MGLAVGFSTPALGLEGMVLCSADTPNSAAILLSERRVNELG